ncbi:MAG TPA: hypothetical protein VMU94_11125 [Streptosporangiaceae bacterium]|nr:hypothetical protein [Streptosporangiaceae bacterium]
MCSTPVQRIAEIGQAIDDLAADAQTAYAAAALQRRRPVEADAGPAQEAAPSEAAATAPASDTDQVVIRLAELWALLAKLDPEVARRLPTYEA